MSEQRHNESTGDERLDENLSRLLSHETQHPQLSPQAEGRMLAALLKKQREFQAEATVSDEEKVVSRSDVTPHESASRPANYLLVGAVSLILAFAIVGVVGSLLSVPSNKIPPEGLGPQAEVRAVKFQVGELTRKELDDGTILIAHSGTVFEVAGHRKVTLNHGDLYLIVAKAEKPFVVTTTDGDVTATGTRFVVSSHEKTTAAVAQGTVQLMSDSGTVALQAGEQGEFRSGKLPTRRPAPRLSYLVSWAKEALSQGALLVEKVDSENGLVAMDPWGQQTRLTLRKYHVDVHIEDGIARTTIDQTFFNHYPWNSEGTFYFPLPPDASVSRLAMYVAGNLNEGGMVERGRGQQIYNDILYQRRDPALLEMMEGNVFKMRIFPLEGRQEKRIFLSYTQKLDELYGRARYWFPMDHTNSIAKQLSIRVRIKDGAKLYNPQSSTHKLEASTDGDDLVLTYDAEKVRPDQDLLLHLVPGKVPPAARAATCEKDGHQFVFAQFSPEIPGKIEPQPRQWVVINDVSASRGKIDAQAQRYILERLIEEADDEDTLFLINLNTRPELASERFTPIRSNETKKVLEFASAARLGATNLVAGMEAAAKVIAEHKAANPHILYLGDGVATDGSTEVFEPVRAVPRSATFVGIGVGKKVDSLFLQEAADRTGGTYTTINPDEDIDWRVFDLLAALNTPRLTKIRVELQDAVGQPLKADAYPNSRSLAHGETLTVVARCRDELPAKIVLRGDAGEKPYRSVADVSQARPQAEYIPRLWAKRHIDELLKSDMGREKEIVDLSKKYYVVTPLTSLIVLEDDKMYEEYQVERGRKDHWALYGAPKKIEVVKEPVDWKYWGWYGAHVGDDEKIESQAQPKTVREIVDSVQIRIDAPFYFWQPREPGHGRYALYHLIDSDVKPTRLLTYWMLIAAGEKRIAIDLRQGRSRQPESTTSPDGTTADSVAQNGPPLPTTPAPAMQLEFIGQELILPILSGQSEGTPLSVTLFDAKVSGDKLMMPPAILAGGETLSSMLLRSSDSRSPFGPSFVASGPLPGDGLFAISGRRPPLMRLDGERGKRMMPSMFLSDLSHGTHGQISSGFIRPELAMSFQRELGRRWSRIDRDIRDFNRTHGHWQGWGGWYSGQSIDLTRSANARWYGGLEGLLGEDEELPASSLLPQVSSDPAPASMLLATGKKYRQVAVAWMSVFSKSLHTQPGACSVLAADYLTSRRGELARVEQSETGLSQEEKIELRAIEKALGNINSAVARLEDTGVFWGWQGWSYQPQPWTFNPPTVQVHQGYNWSFDLTRYTPALQSTSFDILDEVAAQYSAKPQGSIDENARQRIDAARAAIKDVTIRFAKEGPAVHVASGDRFAVSRRTDMYLQERMVCDGDQIVHVYDELGLAARRSASPLRLATLRQLSPHLLEPAEALATRYDIALADSDDDGFTLQLTPVGQKTDAENPIVLTMQVDNIGRVHHKTLTVGGEVQLKLTFAYGEGEVTAAWFDADNKQLTEAKIFVTPLAEKSAFELNLDDTVVVNMPLRKPSFYHQQVESLENVDEPESNVAARIDLKRHHALALIQQLQWRRWGGTNSEAKAVLNQMFALCKQAKQEPKIGDLTLLGSAGVYHAPDEFGKHSAVDESHPVYRFFKLRNSDWTTVQKELEGKMDGLLGHLAAYQACAYKHKITEHYDFFVENYPDSPLQLAATYYSATWGRAPQRWIKLFDNPRWRLLAILMSAPHLQTDEQRTGLANAYVKMYDELSDDEIELPLTAELVAILKGHKDGATWKRITGEKFARAEKGKSTAALLKFAEDAMSWGEAPLADDALALARERLAEKNLLSGRFALAQTYWAGGRRNEAMKIYDDIFVKLKAKKISPSAGLLASAARLAQQSGDLGRAIELEEQALAAEHPYLPDLINLQAFRQRYNWLWQQYQAKIHQAISEKDDRAVTQWLDRAATTWQRWHEIDPENHDMITQMASLQMTAGNEADAWLYLSTIIDLRPRDANSHFALSQWYRGRSELDKAEERLAQAYQWDTANPRWLWERGQLLQAMDRPDEARQVYQQIVDGEWANALQGYVEQAKQALRN